MRGLRCPRSRLRPMASRSHRVFQQRPRECRFDRHDPARIISETNALANSSRDYARTYRFTAPTTAGRLLRMVERLYLDPIRNRRSAKGRRQFLWQQGPTDARNCRGDDPRDHERFDYLRALRIPAHAPRIRSKDMRTLAIGRHAPLISTVRHYCDDGHWRTPCARRLAADRDFSDRFGYI